MLCLLTVPKRMKADRNPLSCLIPLAQGLHLEIKTVVLEANSTTDKKPEVITKKLCAVGEVNAEKGLAAVMLEDGKVRTVKYTGTAPTSGKVHTYSIKDGVFTFAEYEYYADGVEWRIYDGLADGSADKPDFFVL